MQIHCLTEEDNLQKLDWEEWRVLVRIAGMVTEAVESKLNLLKDLKKTSSSIAFKILGMAFFGFFFVPFSGFLIRGGGHLWFLD